MRISLFADEWNDNDEAYREEMMTKYPLCEKWDSSEAAPDHETTMPTETFTNSEDKFYRKLCELPAVTSREPRSSHETFFFTEYIFFCEETNNRYPCPLCDEPDIIPRPFLSFGNDKSLS